MSDFLKNIRRELKVSAHYLRAPRLLPPNLKKADWATKREIIRAIVQRIEIGLTNIGIVLRLPAGMSARTVEPILVTLSRVPTDRRLPRC